MRDYFLAVFYHIYLFRNIYILSIQLLGNLGGTQSTIKPFIANTIKVKK